MNKKLLSYLSILATLTIVSCQKELSDPTVTAGIYAPGGGSGGSNNSGSGGSVVGNWKFISMYVVTQAVAQVSQSGVTYKTVTNSDYTTAHNTGTMSFTSNVATVTDMSFDVTDTAFATTYLNGVSMGTLSQPFSQSQPSYSLTSPYTQVNPDSIYIDQGFAGSGGAGYHVSISGTTLKLTTAVVADTLIDLGGLQAMQHETATAVITLQKQ